MPNLLRADAYTLVRSRTLWICLVACAAMAAGYFYASHLIATGSQDMSIAGSVSGLSDVLAINLLGALAFGVIVSEDFETRTVHDRVLVAGRATIVTTKAVVAVGAIIVLMLPYIVGAAVCFVLDRPFSVFLATTPLLLAANPDQVPVDASSVGRVVLIGLATAVLYAARLSFCLPLAFWTRRPVIVLAAGFVGNFVIDFLSSLATGTWVDRILRLTPYARADPLSLASSGGQIAASLAASAVFLVAMGVAAWLVFRRADIA